MAEYMLFIWDDEQAWAGADPAVMDATLAAHRAFIEANGPALRGGNRLHPSPAATTVRTAADGTVTVSDGTFAETKEVIGGYYLVEAADLDQALRIARQVPAPFGGVEVRPVLQTTQPS
jgi:hypothetical protein